MRTTPYVELSPLRFAGIDRVQLIYFAPIKWLTTKNHMAIRLMKVVR